MSFSYYWHDYETTGLSPTWDRPLQFAGVRTDEQFNIIEEPLELYCRLSGDRLISPEACLVTGLTPQLVMAEGIGEAEFVASIEAKLAVPGSCGIGYNSIRFDDEVTRNMFFRNFIDPYEREWKNGNSRWDLLDIMRLTAALRPDDIHWPRNDDGTISFRLELLAEANGIIHEKAHDAMSDVYATIGLAKLLSEKKQKLFRFVFQNRSKRAVSDLLDLSKKEPVLHVSGMYPGSRQHIAMVMPICQHPVNSNGIVVFDLSSDPSPLVELSVEEIRERLFTPNDELPEGVERIQLKTVHINRAPVVVPMSVLREPDAERLLIDTDFALSVREWLLDQSGLEAKLAEVFAQVLDGPADDPEDSLYSGGFVSSQDKRLMGQMRANPRQFLEGSKAPFSESRLNELLHRFTARNYPETLSEDESLRWQAYCQESLLKYCEQPLGYLGQIDGLLEGSELSESKRMALVNLRSYAVDQFNQYDLV